VTSKSDPYGEGIDKRLAADRARERLQSLVEELTGEGWSQQQIATAAGLPPQYLSDMKRGHRDVTELVARRLGEQHHVDYRWLLGTSDLKAPIASQRSGGGSAWLPVFGHPIAGDPRTHPKWDGSGVEVAGATAAKLARARDPYVLRFGRDDVGGRLHLGDLLLVSQRNAAAAEIHVVKYRGRLFLARRTTGGFERLANGQNMPASSPVKGHCLGVIWSSLVRE